MQCHEFQQVLEQHELNQLPAEAATHLSGCGQCRALASDLESIRVAGREMAAAEMETPERLWLSLRAQLEAENLIRAESKTARRAGWLEGWFAALPRPVLAGVYLGLLLAAAVLVGTRGDLWQAPAGSRGEGSPAVAALGTQLKTAERRAASTMHPHNPAITASLRRNLDIVDNAIALCEKSVREEPQNELAREYLYGAYQQKAELLAMMVDRGATGD